MGRSLTYPKKEIEKAMQMAKRLEACYIIIDTDELTDDNFRKNPVDRCYFCKNELFSKLTDTAENEDFNKVIDGSNADDSADWRPGSKAASKYQVVSPLKESGISKNEVRELAKKEGLKNWNKPAMACLASRFPYGQIIEEQKLQMVEEAEDFLFDLGLSQVRVRIDKDTARIEVLPAEFDKIINNSNKISDYFKTIGFIFITLDLQGFKSGSLNKTLPKVKEIEYA
ncbi:MAG: ATP-dependent sacrificial sulfur transferase LarE [Actinobacteria bacterium]|nr:MAG: ATP-dependent sacrificial sulfur transferase LarE [Actinomycetota bacterium]